MPRVGKIKKTKSYRYNVNRKRSNKREQSTGTIQNPEMRKAWNNHKTMNRNLKEMGLAADSNLTLGFPSAKQQRVRILKLSNGFVEEDVNPEEVKTPYIPPRDFIVKQMETDANALRETGFRLPKGVVKFATYLIDKYGLDYKAMVRDEKNYDQETWKQFRSKIRKFMSVPEQFDKFLKERNLDPNNLDWVEYNSDDDIDA